MENQIYSSDPYKYHSSIHRSYIFGKIKIDKNHLNNNRLIVKSNTPSIRYLFKNDISDEMRIVFKNLFIGKEINYKLLQDLSMDEKELFKKFMKKTGLSPDLDFNAKLMNYTKQDIKQMYKRQIGIIEAGNDSEELKEDLSKTIKLMIDFKLITQDEADDVLSELNS
jgi:hypothetical protein